MMNVPCRVLATTTSSNNVRRAMSGSNPKRISLQSAYVLHTRPYRDTSLLVEIFSHDYGRLGLVARGVRTSKSRYASLLQPFMPLLMSWSGQGELVTLSGAEAAGVPPRLSGELLLSGFYLNELLMRLLQRGDAHPSLFENYITSLASLAEQTEQEPILRQFEHRLLQEIGYGLVLDHDVMSGKAIDPAARYNFLPDRGPICSTGQEEDGIIVQGRTLLAIVSDDYSQPDVRQEAKRLMRAALAVHLGDRPLKSRELFQQQRSL